MYFVVHESSNSRYYFVIMSHDNQVVATSEMHQSKTSALQTIESIKSEMGQGCNVIDMSIC